MRHPGIELRAEGLLVRDHRLLLVEHVRDEECYWVLPGGHVEPGEELSETVRREFREELTLEVTARGLLWVHQFIRPERHTVNFSFLLGCADMNSLRLNPGRRLKGFRWFTVGELGTIDLRPPLADVFAGVCEGRVPKRIEVYHF